MKTEILYIVIPFALSPMLLFILRKYLNEFRLGHRPTNSSESIIDIVLGADAGDPDYLEKLAWCYRKGDGVPQSKTYARELMVRARQIRNQT